MSSGMEECWHVNLREDLASPCLGTEDQIITINVGGQRFQTQASTFRNHRIGILYNLSKRSSFYNQITEEYWFDRDPVFFRYILQYYRTGRLHVEGNHCAHYLKAEMEFWGFNDNDVSFCCWMNVCEARNKETDYKELRNFALEPDIGVNKSMTLRQSLWRFLNHPSSSIPAKTWCLLSVCLILVSVTCAAISTLPAIKAPVWEAFTEIQKADPRRNSTRLHDVDVTFFYLTVAETSCLVFFTVDLFLRLLGTPSVYGFMKSVLFLLDILFIVPGWIIVGILLSDSSTWILVLDNTNLLMVLQLAGLTRVFRVFRLGWYAQGFRILILVFRKSGKELVILGSILAINLTLFGFLIYTAEMSTNPQFDSAFRGFWWAITTMSTLGYGDIVPVTVFGYIVGGACTVSGVVVIGLVIPIIATNFRVYYSYQPQVYPKQKTCKM